MENKEIHVVWSINSNTDAHIDDWIDENKVGYKDENGIRIPKLKDGDYTVSQKIWASRKKINLKNKVSIFDGKVNIESCKEAVAEFMKKTGDWHYFIEFILYDSKSKKISFLLGS